MLTPHQKRVAMAMKAQRMALSNDEKPTFWQEHGGEIMVGVITAVVSAVATYFAMKAVAKE